MIHNFPSHNMAFDAYADGYDAALAQGLSVSGEDKYYFARGRLEWLAACLRQLHEHPRSVMDFGCGTGTSVPFFIESIGVDSIIGLDSSPQSLVVAKRTHRLEQVQFSLVSQYQPNAQLDLAFCNGVFHHIPSEERADAVTFISRTLRPGGLFALWENNPWNPGTRYVMRRIPFDRDAVPLTPLAVRRLLRASGFRILRTDFLFIFPRMLRWFRGLEPWVSRLPFGAQYQVLACKLDAKPERNR
jgi:SAM-dependent methyltransferase